MFTRRHFIILLLYAALTLLFFHRLIVGGQIMARGDVYTYFYPYWAARSEALLAGRIPLWSPDIFMGVPLLANSQIGVFYPPNWLVTPLSPPDAINWSIILHLTFAMLGVYALTRRRLSLDALPAFVAGLLFGLGGYLTAQVEHINQLQALAWLPWIFLAVSGQRSAVKGVLRWLAEPGLMAALIALQFLAGHPQTVFITLVGVVLYRAAIALSEVGGTGRWMRLAQDYARLGLALLLTLPLIAPQLIPTLELMGLSHRGGGLEAQGALAFSFNPFLIGRALLPSYDSLIFTEYVAYPGIIGLGLALIALVALPFRRLLPFVLLALVGLGLALGAYNPLNWLITLLPGFSFFRVPARWLALFALGLAALSGVGLQALVNRSLTRWRLALLVILIVVIGLAGASFLAERAAENINGPALPTSRTLLGWGAALLGLLLLVGGVGWLKGQRSAGTRAIPVVLTLGLVLELLLASSALAYNQTAPADVYSASRFSLRQLQVYAEEQLPAGRTLSITPLQFDPGDAPALEARYAALGMSELGTRIALVATKMRETLAPNLALVWGLPSIDGFDGGLLPTEHYSRFSALLLPDGVGRTQDGRLWEMLALPECRGACIPEQRWLNLTHTRYLITDKTADVVRDGVFYDTSFSLPLLPDQPLTVPLTAPFEATAVDMLYTPLANGDCPLIDIMPVAAPSSAAELVQPDLCWQRLVTPIADDQPALQLTTTTVITLRAITLVDTRTGAFQGVTLPPWRRVLSSDIKLYENQAVLPRAFLVYQARIADDEAALEQMRDPAFDPAQTVILAAGTALDAPSPGLQVSPTITAYEPKRVEIAVTSPTPAYLVLTDAWYPGWSATVNDQPVTIERANLMFRAIPVPAGESRIVFRYQPGWWPGALVVGALGWLLLATIGILRKAARVR